ncbi:MAG: methylated-DNA--[protein]-cysteine S-methyltransferase [Frankia sp.]|nr:methylated-DNA--[protein]-cysteine S-methyltransferase [Frankia sp.]
MAGVTTDALAAPYITTPDALVTSFRRRAAAESLVDVAYCTVDTPIARLTVAATPRGVVATSYADADTLLPLVARRVSPRVLEAPERLDDVRRQLDDYFARRRTNFELPLDWSLVGSDFGRAVLGMTQRIGYGERSTYQHVAALTGHPAASRAVGNALGANPLCIVVPCHRVLRTGGGLGGYAGGLDAKAALLALESQVSRD